MSNKATRASKNNKQHALVPRLRFPEFRDGQVWEQKPLSVLTVPVNERVGDSDCVPYTITSGEGLVSQEEKYGRTIAGRSLKNYYRLQHNDFAFNKSATKVFPQGYIARFQGHELAAVPNSIFTCFRIADENVDAAYLDYLFQGNLHGRWLKNYITVGARAHGALNISDDDLYALPVPLPVGDKSLAEQQKIANCLGSLDDMIAAEGRKLAALWNHKKGLMQLLFPREGETRPCLRFPEFRDAPEWEEEPLGEVCSINPRGNGLPESFIYIDLESVVGGVLINRNWIQREDAPSRAQRLLQQEDVIFQIVRPYQRNNLFVDFEEEGPFVASTGYAQLRAFACKQFLYQAVHNDAFVNKVIAKCTGSSYPAINSKDLAEILLPVPPTNGEQHRIADCLSALDAMIAAQAEKFDALADHKRGLVQQLFPSLEGAKT